MKIARYAATLPILAAIALTTNASAGQFQEGSWRLELSGLRTVECRDEAWYGTASVEYEFPAYPHGKLGLRLYPGFLYGSEPIFGAGAGVATRVYQHGDRHDGLFGEVGVSVLWHSRDFEANSCRVNFLSEAGIGYKFTDGWHVTLKLDHISNAGLGEYNGGINGLGLAAGYTF